MAVNLTHVDPPVQEWVAAGGPCYLPASEGEIWMSAYPWVLACTIVLATTGPSACKRDRSPAAGASPVASEGAPASSPPAPPPPARADDETVPAAPDPKETIRGTITVPASRRKDLAKTDIVYIIARRAGAPPGPGSMIAVQKHPLGEFPMPFTLSGRDSMLPGRPFAGRIDVTVRIDKDGDGLTRKKGDLHGQANDIAVGTQDLAISVDTLQTEDQVLPGLPTGSARGGKRPSLAHP
jgi:hypothetical protein